MKSSGHRIELGKRSEEVAVAWLRKKGYVVLDRNFRGYRGEVDIIAMKAETVYLVEVRSRNFCSGCADEVEGEIRESVRKGKISRITRTGFQFMQERNLGDADMEVLIIAVTWYNPGCPKITAIPVY